MSLNKEKEVIMKFKDSDLEKIKKAVAEAEKTTSGEIVPFVTEIADEYLGGSLSFTLVLILIAVLVYLLSIPWPAIGILLLIQVIALLVGLTLSGIFPKLKVLFAAKETIREETRQRAIQQLSLIGQVKLKMQRSLISQLLQMQARSKQVPLPELTVSLNTISCCALKKVWAAQLNITAKKFFIIYRTAPKANKYLFVFTKKRRP